MPPQLTWTDVEDIGIELAEAHPGRDPISVRFTELRELVEALEAFGAEAGQQPNEQILEAIQQAWCDEAGAIERDEDEGYSPPVAYKPDE